MRRLVSTYAGESKLDAGHVRQAGPVGQVGLQGRQAACCGQSVLTSHF